MIVGRADGTDLAGRWVGLGEPLRDLTGGAALYQGRHDPGPAQPGPDPVTQEQLITVTDRPANPSSARRDRRAVQEHADVVLLESAQAHIPGCRDG